MDNDHSYEVSSSQEEVFSQGWSQYLNDGDIPWGIDGIDVENSNQAPDINQFVVGNEIEVIQNQDIYNIVTVDASNCQPLINHIFKEEIAEDPPPQTIVVNMPNASYMPCSLPPCENWPGEYEFTLSLGKSGNSQWTYSHHLNKLFVIKDAACPINFSTKCPMPNGAFIKAMVLYSSPESISEVVKRCINHSDEDRKKNIFEAEHLIRCDSQQAIYDVDPISNHHMVLIPFDNPAAGQSFSTYIYKFTCLGSCPGPDRRPLMVIFTLLNGNEIVGRGKLNVKICACPKRDKNTDENKFFQQHDLIRPTIKQSSKKPMPKKKKRSILDLESLPGPRFFPKKVKTTHNSDDLESLPGPSIFHHPKKVKTSQTSTSSIDLESSPDPNKFPQTKKTYQDSDGNYVIKIKDKKRYEFLKQMNKYYDIMTTIKSLAPEAVAVLGKYVNDAVL